MLDTKGKLEICISADSKLEVDNFTGQILKQAVGKMKPDKTDDCGSFVSNILKNASNLLFDQFA